MILKPARLLLALIAVVAMPAFAQNAAVVNGKAIPSSRVESVVKQVVAQGEQPDSPELRASVKENLIAGEVLYQEAQKRGFDNNASVKDQLEAVRQSIIIEALMRAHIAKNPVKDADIQAEYDKYKEFTGKTEYKVGHILLATEAEAKAVIARLKGGAKFEELAKDSKDAGSAATGGDLGWGTPSALPKVFSDAFVALKKGEVTSTPVQTPSGYHVIRLEDTRPAVIPALAELKPRIGEAIQQKRLQEYQMSLINKATIK
jgi:peptidyl-prolyl cis-trans isomerase C